MRRIHRIRRMGLVVPWAFCLAVSGSLTVGAGTALGACDYGGYVTNTRTMHPGGYPEISYTSTVTYRLGLCGGTTWSLHLYRMKTTWSISENDWGLTRTFNWFQAWSGGSGDRLLIQYIVNKSCTKSFCTLTSDNYPSTYYTLTDSTNYPYVRARCGNCGLFGGSAIGIHWFVTGNIDAYWQIGV